MKLSPSALSFTIQLSLAVVVLAQTQSTTRTFNSFPGDTTDVSDSIPLSTTTIFVTASFPAFSTTVGIPQPEASPAVVPNTDKTPVDEGPQPSHLRAQVVIVIFGLLNRRSRYRRRNSKLAVDEEAAVSSSVPCSNSTAAPHEQNLDSMRKIEELETQARRMQEELVALRRVKDSNTESECDKGYTVNIAQREKFDSFAARARELRTHREPDPTEDALPCYKQFEFEGS